MVSLYQVLIDEYPNSDIELMNYLKNLNESGKLVNWKDFALALSSHYYEDDMTVGKSSTWAVSQEFLGKLKGYDLKYAQSRGGIWNLKTSVREILNRFMNEYPEIK